MATNPPTQPPWVNAVRYLTLGAVVVGLGMCVWLIARIADRVDAQSQLLVNIQRDVLVNQSQVAAVLAVSDQNSRRLINVEERVGRAAEDRMQMREIDQELIESMVRIKAELDNLFPAVDPPTTGPTSRGRLKH